MPVLISWGDIVIRLVCTVAAGAIVGLNRDERGHQAGMRTTILVALAAAVAMIQANRLMPTTGKAADSFVVLDLMRLPLGILTGIGFIGAGAILRRGSLVVGVTTAATLWVMTVIGLCFGGGQLGLGAIATAITILVLWNLKWLETRIPQVRRATLTISLSGEQVRESDIHALLQRGNCYIVSWGVSYGEVAQAQDRVHASAPALTSIRSEIRWRADREHPLPPAVIEQIASIPGILSIEWRP